MSLTARRTSTAAAVLAFFVLTGCASSGGSGGGDYRGVQLYKQGEGIYVCREAHTADTRSALVEKLRSGEPVSGASTGASVSVVSREDADVGGEPVSLARVEPADGGSRYWIPYTALCSRGG